MTEWLHGFIQQIIEFAGANPTLVGLILCLSAGAEAVLLVGALVPGEALVLGVAAAAGAAGLDILPMVLWTTVGAIIGDGISYWIGHSKGTLITSWRPLQKRPQLLQQGEDFIEKHGTKSILIARFLPGLRAIVPVAAGVLGMEPKRFYFANSLSAFGWAVLHILPAAGLGVAYHTLGDVSGRLAALLVLSILTLMLGFWLLRLLVNKTMPLLARFYASLIKALAQLPYAPTQKLAGWLDPAHPRLAGMAFWAFALLVTMLGFVAVLENFVLGDPLVRGDVAINQLMGTLRNEPMDQLMIWVTSYADATPVTIAALTLIALLLMQRAVHLAGAVALFLGTATLFVPLLKNTLHKARPMALYDGAESFSFPSGHTTLSTVLFGLLAVLLARRSSARGKMLIYGGAGLWILTVGLSRIYLSAHWPSDVLGGLLFGLMLTAAFALLVEQLDQNTYRRALLGFGVLTTYLLAGGIYGTYKADDNRARYAERFTPRQITLRDWLDQDWQKQPATRIDLKGQLEEAFWLQWAGKEPQLTALLARVGWQKAQRFTWLQGLELLLPSARLRDFSPLPLLHNGKFPALTYVLNKADKPDERLVLRLWCSTVRIKRGHESVPLLLGSVRREGLTHPLGLATALRQRTPQKAFRHQFHTFWQKLYRQKLINMKPASLPASAPLRLWPPN